MIKITPEELRHSFIFRTPLVKPAGVISFEKTAETVIASFMETYHNAQGVSKKTYIDIYPEHNELLCEVEYVAKNLKTSGFNAELVRVESPASSNHSSDSPKSNVLPDYFYVRIYVILEIEKCDMTVESALNEAYSFDRNDEGRLAARTLMLFIERSILNNRLADINDLIKTADLSKLKTRSLIGLFRASSRISDYLPAWKDGYFNARDRMVELGKDPQVLFVGMNDITR